MPSRDAILSRIRQALRQPAPEPGHGAPAAKDFREVLPFVGPTPAEWLALFAERAAELKADFHWLSSPEKATERLRDLAAAEGWRRVASHRGAVVTPLVEALALPILLTDDGYDVHALESCDVGVTECVALVAQTGSVVVTSRSSGGRALSVLPPHHVVVARKEQLAPDLPAAFLLLQAEYGADWPSMISFVTGPSRTGDIERILVLGAHGPKKLTILCF